MSDLLKNMRAFARGAINEEAFEYELDDDEDGLENDEEFLQECMNVCAPTLMMMEIMDENADILDEEVKDAFLKVQDYLVGQGYITEAATVSLNNPKVTVVKLSRAAQLKRLTTIITLKLGRKSNDKHYKKYKLGQKIKKENMAAMRQKYGNKAERIAKKLQQKMKKNGKVNAVVAEKKKTVSKKK